MGENCSISLNIDEKRIQIVIQMLIFFDSLHDNSFFQLI